MTPCSTRHPDFISLTRELDRELNQRYKNAQAKYDAHNQMDFIPTAMVAYEKDTPAACGCFKEMSIDTVEIKRMYVRKKFRKQGIGRTLLTALESWAGRLGFTRARLETGKGQPEAMAMYKRCGYRIIPNYGPYEHLENSVCMEKKIVRADFSDRLVQILNHGALNLALGMGYALKIFDVMDQQAAALTLDELAGATGLNARYLKEWLGIMVTGEIVQLLEDKTDQDRFHLPRAHGDLLCRRAGSRNLGVYTQEIPLLTSCAMTAVENGFTTGQGIPFSQYPAFQAFMSELSDAKHEQVLINEFLPSVDKGRLVERLTAGIRACDLGCGQGVALNLMARAFPRSQFTGIDTHEQAIETARASARAMGLSNVDYLVLDAASVCEKTDLAHSFEYICAFDAVHDQSHPLKALKGVLAMLSPDGIFSMIDIKAGTRIQDNMTHPMAPFLYTVSLMHCMPVGLNDNGRGLGMMWGKEQALDLLRQAGFTRVCAEEIPNDAFNLHFVCRP